MNDKLYDILKFLKGKGTRIIFVIIFFAVLFFGKEKITEIIGIAGVALTAASQITSSVVKKAKNNYYVSKVFGLNEKK